MQELIKLIEQATECAPLSIDDVILEKWDSLEQIYLVVEIESTYGIKFTLSQVANMKTIRDIWEAVNECQENNKKRS